MQKKIIALAVAGLVSGAAFAQTSNVTIWGIADVSYGYFSKSHNADTKSVSKMSDGYQDASRVGFKGTEDLGNGLSAFFSFEQRFFLDEASIEGRNSHLGLTSKSWGTVRAGSFGSVHDDYNGYSESGGMGYGNGTVHKIGEDNAHNAIEYISPNFSGLEFKLGLSTAYQGEEEEAVDLDNSALNDDINDRAYFAAIAYNNGGLKLAATYDKTSYQIEAPGTDSGNEYMLAASYNFGPVAVGAGYDRTKFFNQDVRKTWRVTAAAPITANDTIGLSYSRGSVDIDEGESYDAKGWGLSYSHAMSKRTNVYATYGQMSQDNELNNTKYSFALADSYERAFRVGMRHFF